MFYKEEWQIIILSLFCFVLIGFYFSEFFHQENIWNKVELTLVGSEKSLWLNVLLWFRGHFLPQDIFCISFKAGSWSFMEWGKYFKDLCPSMPDVKLRLFKIAKKFLKNYISLTYWILLIENKHLRFWVLSTNWSQYIIFSALFSHLSHWNNVLYPLSDMLVASWETLLKEIKVLYLRYHGCGKS